MEHIEANAEWKSSDRILVRWDNQKDEVCKVERRLADTADWDTVFNGVNNICLDIDSMLSTNKNLSYRAIVDEKVSEPFRPNMDADDYLLGISEDVLTELEISNGHVCYVFCKVDEQPCPYCYSEALGKRIRTKCDYCDGSGWIGGWQGPLKVYAGILSIKDEIREVYQFEKEETYLRVWLGNTPLLSRGDIVKFPNNTEYIVNQKPEYKRIMSRDNRQNFVIKQTLILKEKEDNKKLKIPNE